MPAFVDRELLSDLLARVGGGFPHRGTIFLLGQTGLLWERWVERAELVEIATVLDARKDAEDAAADDARRLFDQRVAAAARDLGVEVIDESPGDVIPLPAGHEERARDAGPLPGGDASGLRLAHFDPYSIAFRYIARGDEPDYHVALHLLRRGWIEMEELEERLEALLPSFSMETIQQDPAEFRRKYHGLQQMWRAVRPGTTHRPTPV